MVDPINPLPNNQKIVNPDGTPTQFMTRWAQERSIDISNGVTLAQVEQAIDDWAAARQIAAGHGLSGGGNLSADVTIALDASLSDLNDVDFTTPPTDGQTLEFDAAEGKFKPTDQSGGIPDAPADGKLYGRENNAWVEVPTTPPSSGGVLPLVDGSIPPVFIQLDDGNLVYTEI